MKIQLKQLSTNLKSKLAPAYLLHGDVPLLIQDARKLIRRATESAGFNQRELLQIESGFNWSRFLELTQNLGLFSEKRIIEILNPSGKFDTNGIAALLKFCEFPTDDTILVICTGKLTPAQQKSRWFKAIEKIGVTIPVWPIAIAELPSWIKMRFQQAKLSADANAYNLLAELTEGNLLATQQAIEKIRLLYPNEKITAHHIASAASDNARFNVFDLINYMLQGHCRRVLRVLDGLHYDGTEPTLILWAVTRETRQLIQLHSRLNHGETISQVLQHEWRSRQTQLRQALSRTNMNQLNQILMQSENVDRMIKGLQTGNTWDNLQTLCLALTGKPLLNSKDHYV